uniref:aldehyde dehydrogenase family protein n=1 Tax=Streptomyces sp. Agncl-13 TaxID=3400628 RepID=UPI003A8B6C08
MAAAPVWSVDPRTGKQREQVAVEATAQEVDTAVRAAHAARGSLADRTVRAAFLRGAADQLEAAKNQLVEVADAETALGPVRLNGELARTCYQLRAFADIVDEGAFLDVVINHPDDTATPPIPDLRRYKVPLGVVAVYSASNFPFAFSVPGGDTASALAAGCPVVVKAHPDHPGLSELVASVLRRAAAEQGIPAGVLGLVHGFEAGVELVKHPLVSAAGFTGSVRGGRALFDAAAARPVPIPFHGELGSLNPVVITEAAAAERAEAIGAGLAGSMTLGVGQFCVKPGLVLVPSGSAGDGLVKSLTDAVSDTDSGVLLDHRMRDNFLAGVTERAQLPDVDSPVTPGAGSEHTVSPGGAVEHGVAPFVQADQFGQQFGTESVSVAGGEIGGQYVGLGFGSGAGNRHSSSLGRQSGRAASAQPSPAREGSSCVPPAVPHHLSCSPAWFLGLVAQFPAERSVRPTTPESVLIVLIG